MSKVKYFPRLNITVLFDWYSSAWMRGKFDITVFPKFHHIPIGQLLLGKRVTILKQFCTETVEHNGHIYTFERGGAYKSFKNLTRLIRLRNPTNYYTKLTSETDKEIYTEVLGYKTLEQCHFLKALKDACEMKTLIDGLKEDMRKQQ